MARTNIPLDPTKTGLEAKRLALDLQGLIVGQDEPIEQIDWTGVAWRRR